MKAAIRAIECYLPQQVLTNDELAAQFPEWTPAKMERKTGIAVRHIAAEDECASDLGVAAARQLFDSAVCTPEEVDYLLFCTQSPDYFLPSSSCLMQQRLGLVTSVGALDFNLGCSGFVYGLGIAKGLIETGQAQNVLLITAETYSKYIHPDDKSVRVIFGDGAAATLVQGRNTDAAAERDFIGPFVYGTDGRGRSNLTVTAGAMRYRNVQAEEMVSDDSGNHHPAGYLYMNGAEIFSFTLSAVPAAFERILSKSGRSPEDIDLYVFHQANQYMLEHLRKKLGIPSEKFVLALREYGNTVSVTIPIALKQAEREGKLVPGQTVMLVGFGVGYSWAAALIQWVE